MDSNHAAHVLQRTNESSTTLRMRIAVGEQQFEATAFVGADGTWQLSVRPADAGSHPLARARVTPLPGNDVEFAASAFEQLLLWMAARAAEAPRSE